MGHNDPDHDHHSDPPRGDRKVRAPLEDDRSDQVCKVRVLPEGRRDHRGKARVLARILALACSPCLVVRTLHHHALHLKLEVHTKTTSRAHLGVGRLAASLEPNLARVLRHYALCARAHRTLCPELLVAPCHKLHTRRSPVHAHPEKAPFHNLCLEAPTHHAPALRGDTHAQPLRHTPHAFPGDSLRDACRRVRTQEVADESLGAAMPQTHGHLPTNQAAVVMRAERPHTQGLPAAANVAKRHANHALRGGGDAAGAPDSAGMADARPQMI